MASSYLTESDEGYQRYQRDVTKSAQRSNRLQRKFLNPTALNRKLVYAQKAANRGEYSQAGYEVGHWTVPDEDDTDLEIRHQLVDLSAHKHEPFGVPVVDDKVIQAIKRKKDKEEQAAKLQLAGYLIDTKEPSTQKNAFRVCPELLEVPEEYHKEYAALQESVRRLLRDGRLSQEGDNDLVYEITDPGFRFPIYPQWDPQGMILGDPTIQQTIEDYQYRNAKQSIFAPRMWSGGFYLE